jgi:hypothetical protein
VTTLVLDRFTATHDLTLIDSRARDAIGRGNLFHLTAEEARSAVQEGRPCPQQWGSDALALIGPLGAGAAGSPGSPGRSLCTEVSSTEQRGSRIRDSRAWPQSFPRGGGIEGRQMPDPAVWGSLMPRRVLVEGFVAPAGPPADASVSVTSTLGFGDVEQRGTARCG